MENRFTKSNFMTISQDVLDFQLEDLYPVQTEKDPTRVNLVFLNHDKIVTGF